MLSNWGVRTLNLIARKQGCLEAGSFPPERPVRLSRISEFDEASEWCAERHFESGRGYRRWTQQSRTSASFEFESDFDALDFKLRYG